MSNLGVVKNKEAVKMVTEVLSEPLEKSSSQKIKEAQLNIILKNNPMKDDFHTGIRSVKDILSAEEAFLNSDGEAYSYPDFSRLSGDEAIANQEITIYSSSSIKPGSFVSPSKMMAEDYSGGGKIFSKKVNINDVAWINGDEGQYAKIVDPEKPLTAFIRYGKGDESRTARITSKNQSRKDFIAEIKGNGARVMKIYDGNVGYNIFEKWEFLFGKK